MIYAEYQCFLEQNHAKEQPSTLNDIGNNSHNVATIAFERAVLSSNSRMPIVFLLDFGVVFRKEWADFIRLSKSDVDNEAVI